MMCKPEVLIMWLGRTQEKSRNVVAAIALGMIAAYVATADTPREYATSSRSNGRRANGS